VTEQWKGVVRGVWQGDIEAVESFLKKGGPFRPQKKHRSPEEERQSRSVSAHLVDVTQTCNGITGANLVYDRENVRALIQSMQSVPSEAS
jgi:hypothetical protein